MKTYKNLYQEIISTANIEIAIREATRSHGRKNRKKKEKLKALSERADRVQIVRGWIERYETRKCKPREIYDGISRKKRYIYVPTVKETVVQHAIVQVLGKYLGKGMYDHTYAALKGRGAHRAKKWIEGKIRGNPRGVKYYLKMDVKQYFPSVPQAKLMEKLERQVKDHRTLELVRKTIAACDEGIPLGYYISQWIANYYLQGLDRYIKEELGCEIYARWMDDMVVFSSNKRKLHKVRLAIADRLEAEGLRMKGNWRVQRFAHGEERGKKKCKGCFLDFMGFRFYRNRTTMRESIFYRATRKARRIAGKEKPTIHELRQFMSYVGWYTHTDSYGAYLDYIKPYVCIQNAKRRISRHDRKENRDAKSRLQESNGLSGRKTA